MTGPLNLGTTLLQFNGVSFLSAPGTGNVVIGKGAAAAIASGSNNVIIGPGAGAADATAGNNVFIGNLAGGGTTGANIVALGALAFNGAGAGTAGVAIGFQAGQKSPGGNVIIGPQVGATILTTGTGNIYLGTSSAIDAAVAAESNTLRIGGSGGTAILATGLNTATPAITLVSGQVGTATNDNAAAGRIGEYLSATRLAGASVALTTGVSTDILALSLTAGDWDVSGNLIYAGAGGVSVISVLGWITTASATLPTLPNGGMETLWVGTPPTTNVAPYLSIATGRISIAATTVIYLSTNCQFSGGTVSSYGFIGARRAR
jgi:hypothetical protein